MIHLDLNPLTFDQQNCNLQVLMGLSVDGPTESDISVNNSQIFQSKTVRYFSRKQSDISVEKSQDISVKNSQI